MKYLIFDCDSTVGLPGKPMDDALALLYLLGRPREVEVLGITCTFGNGTQPEVYASTRQLLAEIHRQDIPLLAGADRGEDPRSDAARFIVDTVNSHPGEMSVLAIGSLTNLYGAWLLDNTLFHKIKQIVLMGGYRFEDQGNRYGNPISYCWDVVAAVYLLHPELFRDVPTPCAIKEHALKAGWLAPNREECRDNRILNLPAVSDAAAYRREMFSGWQAFQTGEDVQ